MTLHVKLCTYMFLYHVVSPFSHNQCRRKITDWQGGVRMDVDLQI